MFEGSRLNNLIPGYTGYIPKNEAEEDILQMQKSKARIPGFLSKKNYYRNILRLCGVYIRS